MAKKGSGAAREEDELWGRRVRELLAAAPQNRLCAECGSRGVTYVDISEGSFVCTACSGALRGLNPPHRVKSISMTTFTEQEVTFLQSRGNEVCRKIWMGLYDSQSSTMPDSRDPQKVKEFLQEKYEKKRWYVPPDQVKTAPVRSSSNISNQSMPAEVKPLRTLLGDSVPALTVGGPIQNQVSLSHARLSQHRAAQLQQSKLQGVQAKKGSTDLLADIGGDPFAAPPSSQMFAGFPAFGGQIPAQAGFANFDAFSSTPAATTFGSNTLPNPSSFHGQHTAAGSRTIANSFSFGSSQGADFGTVPRPTGRIPDMNIFGTGTVTTSSASSVYGTTQVPSLPQSNTGSSYGAFTNPFATSATAPQPSLPSTNPFQTNGMVPGATYGMNVMTGYPAPAAASQFPQTFQQQAFPQPSPFGHQQNGASFGGFPTARPLQRQQGPPAGLHTNPFMVGPPSGPFASRPPTTNPFL
ncbi:arf-GAP domain and FG repeat-containing protein 2 [Lissotriton helveticus]